jgi:proteasome lid subunit RPN8/RPN11
MTQPLNGDLECWRPPQSPFQILYSRLVLEHIRLAVVDAYFLVPRGGLEIGGILLGKYRDRQIQVLDHKPLDCEHAFGPSFSLSPRDEERLKDVLGEVRQKSGGLDPVGWYHSHTRSEICLTEPDLDIHDRYFPEMWQVALVLRPSTSQPARAGFFFRELGGSIRASASYHEFKLEPLRSGPTLLKAEADPRTRQIKGDLGAADPVVALPVRESRPQPAVERIPWPVPERTPAPTGNTRPPLNQAPTPVANSKSPRERPVPLTTERPLLREGAAKPAASRQRLLAPPADPQPAADHGLTPSAPPKPLRERPVPLTPQARPGLERQPAPTLAVRPAQEQPAAPTLDPQLKLERRVTAIVDPAPLSNQRAAAESFPEPAVAPTPVTRVNSQPQVIELPRFLRNEPPPQAEWTRVPLFITAMIFLAIALGGFAFVARDAVLPSFRAFASRVSTSPRGSPPLRIGPAMSINAVDNFGQLQIRWDTSSPSVQAARSAVLSIVDGGTPQRIPLDGPHLEAGAFTYKRRGARVDARLTILTAEGSSVEAATTFLGPPTVAEVEPAPSNAPVGALAKQNAQLRRQLDEQIARNKTLQAQLDRLRKQRAGLHVVPIPPAGSR